MDTLARPSLTLKRRLKAPPAKVYAAWTQAEFLVRWFGPTGARVAHAEADARVGGRYRVVFMVNDEEHDVSGVYREVVPNQKLVFTWTWRSTPERESLVTITVKPDGDGSLLTLLHEQLFDEPTRDSHQQGWSGCLDRLEAFFS
jgi:uncharacterized protein YndB with AHSA1/START domain